MILVDTSVWIDHLRKSDGRLQVLLNSEQVVTHPLVIGELAMGSFKRRDLLLKELHNLSQIKVGNDEEVLQFVSRQVLFGLGIGYIDAHLLAAVKLSPGTLLWTRDRRLREIASKLQLAAEG